MSSSRLDSGVNKGSEMVRKVVINGHKSRQNGQFRSGNHPSIWFRGRIPPDVPEMPEMPEMTLIPVVLMLVLTCVLTISVTFGPPLNPEYSVPASGNS